MILKEQRRFFGRFFGNDSVIVYQSIKALNWKVLVSVDYIGEASTHCSKIQACGSTVIGRPLHVLRIMREHFTHASWPTHLIGVVLEIAKDHGQGVASYGGF